MVVVGATLVDGTGRPPLSDAFVVIEGSRIKAVGHQSQVPLPKGARVVDARGKFLVPRFGAIGAEEAARAMAEQVRAGASPLLAIAALAGDGTVEPGRPANVVILARDPLADPVNLGTIVQVIAEGRLVP